MSYKYSNPFYTPNYQGSQEVIENDNEPIEYKGYLIFKRVEVHRKFTPEIRSVFCADVYDIVRNAKLCGVMAGINGAKRRIDTNQPILK